MRTHSSPASMNDQQSYFDESSHRHPFQNALHPLLYQKLEMEHLEKFLALPRAAHILDFGTGSGRVAFWFLKKGHSVTAIDVSSKSLHDLQKMYRQHKTKNWGKLITAMELPKEDFFDCIVGADILHHVAINTYLPLLCNVLKPSGNIAFSEPNAWHIPWYVHWRMNRIPWHIEKGVFQCTLSNLFRSFRKAGFKNIKITGHGLFPTPVLNSAPWICRQNALVWGNLPWFRPTAFRFIIHAMKPNS